MKIRSKVKLAEVPSDPTPYYLELRDLNLKTNCTKCTNKVEANVHAIINEYVPAVEADPENGIEYVPEVKEKTVVVLSGFGCELTLDESDTLEDGIVLDNEGTMGRVELACKAAIIMMDQRNKFGLTKNDWEIIE